MSVTAPSLGTSPATPHASRGRAEADPDPGRHAAERQCGRCRRHFDVDPTAGPIQEWWLCEPCHDALFGAGA